MPHLLTTMSNLSTTIAGKTETSFNIILNNHRKDSKNKNKIVVCKHFQKSNHNFQRA